jgi:hypothetical protein
MNRVEFPIEGPPSGSSIDVPLQQRYRVRFEVPQCDFIVDCFLTAPLEELFAKVGDGMKGVRRRIVGVLDALPPPPAAVPHVTSCV